MLWFGNRELRWQNCPILRHDSANVGSSLSPGIITSIIPAVKHNFEHNSPFSGVTPKSIIPDFFEHNVAKPYQLCTYLQCKSPTKSLNW